MIVNGDEEFLSELKRTGQLLHQLPHTLQELGDDRRRLLRVSNQVVASGEEVGGRRGREEGGFYLKFIFISPALGVTLTYDVDKPVGEFVSE